MVRIVDFRSNIYGSVFVDVDGLFLGMRIHDDPCPVRRPIVSMNHLDAFGRYEVTKNEVSHLLYPA